MAFTFHYCIIHSPSHCTVWRICVNSDSILPAVHWASIREQHQTQFCFLWVIALHKKILIAFCFLEFTFLLFQTWFGKQLFGVFCILSTHLKVNSNYICSHPLSHLVDSKIPKFCPHVHHCPPLPQVFLDREWVFCMGRPFRYILETNKRAVIC